MKAYIDVRGPWPVMVCGLAAIELRGYSRVYALSVCESINSGLETMDSLVIKG
jgi:hypothetical protein